MRIRNLGYTANLILLVILIFINFYFAHAIKILIRNSVIVEYEYKVKELERKFTSGFFIQDIVAIQLFLKGLATEYNLQYISVRDPNMGKSYVFPFMERSDLDGSDSSVVDAPYYDVDNCTVSFSNKNLSVIFNTSDHQFFSEDNLKVITPLIIVSIGFIILLNSILIFVYRYSRDVESIRSRYNKLIEQKNYGVFIANDRFIINKSCQTLDLLLGYSPFGKHLSDIFTVESFEKIEKMIYGEVTAFTELNLIVEGLGSVPVSCYVYSVVEPSSSVVLEITGFVRDITITKDIEVKKLHQQRIEDISHMSVSIAHELNNHLASLQSTNNVLSGWITSYDHDGSVMDLLEQSEKAVLKSKEIIDNLLTFSKEKEEGMSQLNLYDVFWEAFMHDAMVLSGSNNFFFNYTEESKNIMIKGDKSQLSRMVHCLLINSFNALEARFGSSLDGTLAELKLDLEIVEFFRQYPTYFQDVPKGTYAKVVFTDNGVGISKTEWSKIFFPFYTDKPLGRGNKGLGLSVVWGVIRNHKGFLDIKEVEGGGIAIIIYIPLLNMKNF